MTRALHRGERGPRAGEGATRLTRRQVLQAYAGVALGLALPLVGCDPTPPETEENPFAGPLGPRAFSAAFGRSFG